MQITVQIVGGEVSGVVVTQRSEIKTPGDIQVAIEKAVSEFRQSFPDASLLSGAGSYWIRVT